VSADSIVDNAFETIEKIVLGVIHWRLLRIILVVTLANAECSKQLIQLCDNLISIVIEDLGSGDGFDQSSSVLKMNNLL
jgi:hypothetical protein